MFSLQIFSSHLLLRVNMIPTGLCAAIFYDFSIMKRRTTVNWSYGWSGFLVYALRLSQDQVSLHYFYLLVGNKTLEGELKDTRIRQEGDELFQFLLVIYNDLLCRAEARDFHPVLTGGP